jgi:hypothetical protein
MTLVISKHFEMTWFISKTFDMALVSSNTRKSFCSVKNLLKSLDKEIYVIDIAEYSDLEARLAKIDDSSEVKFVIKDNTTLEAVVKKETSMNTLISYLDNQKIVVNTIRPKGNRLEELFLQILAE